MSQSEAEPGGRPEPGKPGGRGRGSTLAARALSTVVLWAVIGFCLFSGSAPALTALFLLVGAAALWEFRAMWGKVAPLPRAALAVALAYLLAVGAVTWRGAAAHPFWMDLLFIALATTSSLAPGFRGTVDGQRTLLRIGGGVLATLYIPLLFGFLLRLFYLPGEARAGAALLLYVVMVTKFTDMGAYLTGSVFGRHKMAPRISPAKTWEGFAGALAFALLASVGLVLLMGDGLAPLTLPHAVILGLGLGYIAVVGDLAESVLKRCLDTKDSGSFLPGIGGALDLIDSLLFTAPALYFYITLVLPRA